MTLSSLQFAANFHIRAKPEGYPQNNVRALARAKNIWVSPPRVCRNKNEMCPDSLALFAELLFHPNKALTRKRELYAEGILDCLGVGISKSGIATTLGHIYPCGEPVKKIPSALNHWVDRFNKRQASSLVKGVLLGGERGTSSKNFSEQLKDLCRYTLKERRIPTSIIWGKPSNVEVDLVHIPNQDRWIILLGGYNPQTKQSAALNLDRINPEGLPQLFKQIELAQGDSLFLEKDDTPLSTALLKDLGFLRESSK